ncbi:LLM class flavin-dependent oxidoreductase [Kribbella sp. NBC_01505]|uniref:LLM class flavin-dependent oxidoreductase n=1 Tax=Kribbella sp. NBC_01505 TaxID=2903580 RepID=UPI00386E90DD
MVDLLDKPGSAQPWVFAISPRNHDTRTAWREIDATIGLADSYGFTGILAHTGNDTLVNPWLVGQHALAMSQRLRPLIAVNPVYHHPFAVAQFVSSLSYCYGRGLFLNFVAGTSIPDRLALGDDVDHDLRYARLSEYGAIVLRLLESSAPIDVTGEFYGLSRARLPQPTTPESRPVAFVAGQSPAARHCAETLAAVRIQLLSPGVPADGDGLGMYGGLIVRETVEEAWRVALLRYPTDDGLERAAASALRYTDAVWRRAAFAATVDGTDTPPWFWTGPMRSMRADCPFLVGDVETLAGVVAAHRRAGVTSFIFDLAPEETDFAWAARMLERADKLLT